MPRKNGIVLSALVLLGTLVFSCSLFARSPRADAKNKKTLPRAEQASLFYLEGIKSNVLEGIVRQALQIPDVISAGWEVL